MNNETTLTLHKRNGETYNATIIGGQMRTALTGMTSIDLADPTSNNKHIETIFHPHVTGELRRRLVAQGVGNVDDVILYCVWIKGRAIWVCITVPEDIEAMIPHIEAAMQMRKHEWAAREEIEARTVSITLTTCGWGDYGVCEWRGDITRPDADILAECKANLAAAHDPDTSPTDAEILKMIAAARAKWAAKNAERVERDKHKAECLRKAAETGVRVEIRHYTCECRDPHEECSLDVATVWAMPDGTTETTYQHTW